MKLIKYFLKGFRSASRVRVMEAGTGATALKNSSYKGSVEDGSPAAPGACQGISRTWSCARLGSVLSLTPGLSAAPSAHQLLGSFRPLLPSWSLPLIHDRPRNSSDGVRTVGKVRRLQARIYKLPYKTVTKMHTHVRTDTHGRLNQEKLLRHAWDSHCHPRSGPFLPPRGLATFQVATPGVVAV